MNKIDTSGFVSSEEFDTARREIEYPKRPRNPSLALKKKDFDSEAQYFRAMADASEEYEREMAKYKVEREKVGAIEGEISLDFRAFCISEHVDNDVPEEIKSLVYSAAYEEGHSGGYSEIYNAMDDFAEIANRAYAAGKKSK
jgi:hypothetical protein